MEPLQLVRSPSPKRQLLLSASMTHKTAKQECVATFVSMSPFISNVLLCIVLLCAAVYCVYCQHVQRDNTQGMLFADSRPCAFSTARWSIMFFLLFFVWCFFCF